MAGTAAHAGLATEPGGVTMLAALALGTTARWPSARWAGFVLALVAGLALLAAVIPGWSGIYTVAWSLAAVVVYRAPVVGLMALAATVPFEQRLVIPTAVGDLTVSQYLGWALAAGSASLLRNRWRVVLEPVTVAHALVVVAIVASVAAGGVRLPSWRQEVLRWLLPLLVFAIVRALRLTHRQAVHVLASAGVGVIGASLVAVQQLLVGGGPASFHVGGALRVFGPFLHPNTFAGYLVLALPPLAMLALARRQHPTWLLAASTALGTVALLLTQSRGGALAFGMAGVVLLALAPRRARRIVALAAAAIVLAGIASGTVVEIPAMGRFETIVTPASAPVQVTTETWGQLERQAHWGAAWSMMTQDWLFGVGAGAFADAYREHTPEWRFRIARGDAHNGYLHMGAQAGLPGLVAYTGWVGTILVALWQRAVRINGTAYLFSAGALGSAIAYATVSMFEYVDAVGVTILFVMVVAIGLGRDTAIEQSPRRDDRLGTNGATR